MNRDGADDQNEIERSGRQLIQRRHPGDHEDACGHHGGRVNQRRDRGWTFHRIGQPNMQGELRRLAHGTDEQADADDGHQHPVTARKLQGSQLIALGKDFPIVQRAGIRGDQTDAQDEAEITHTVDQKGFHVGKNGCGLVEPKADEQVRNQTNGFPAEEQLQHVVAHDEHQHGKSKKRDVCEEPVVALVFVHVADGVDVHHQ